MKRVKRKNGKWVIPVMAATLLFGAGLSQTELARASGVSIDYNFTGEDKDKAGYAEGTITVSSDTAGTYHLFWADDTKALDGYFEINSKLKEKLNCILDKKNFEGTGFKVTAGGSKSFTLGEHTAIPAGATKIIAVTDTSKTKVSDAVAVYDIDKKKQLKAESGKLLYKFNSYSDAHIDKRTYEAVYYQKSESRFQAALDYAKKMDVEFIASSGDMVTNASKDEFKSEWNTYLKMLASSDYTGNVWEANGNHDLKENGGGKNTMDAGKTACAKATGTDSTIANYQANKPYYYMIEQNTGDVFIFMALENTGSPNSDTDEFSAEQIEWLKNLLDTYYGTGVNIYIVEHAALEKFGSGDNWKDSPGGNGYYGGHMKWGTSNTKNNTEFKELLSKYKNLIFMNGHTHQDFYLGTNYSNENGTACHMIHNPAVVGTTYWSEKYDTQYNSPELVAEKGKNARDGSGYNSQGYYVETYENAVIYHGADLEAQKIYPEYCYIMEGSRHSESISSDGKRQVIQPQNEKVTLDKEIIKADASISEIVSFANNQLNNYVTYASFDQYREVKRVVAQYHAKMLDEKTAVARLKTACESLHYIVSKLNSSGSSSDVYQLRDTYYFENNKTWSKVYCYAWNSTTDKNADWPGVELTEKVGKDGTGSYDIYKVAFSSAGQYKNVIFSNGKEDGGRQTEDIALASYGKNCFCVGDKSASTSTSSTYKVNNYEYGK